VIWVVAIAVMTLPMHFDAGAAGFLTRSQAAADVRPQGFGADTPGGTGQPEYHVTSLADSGPGTLRDAISQGNRRIVFDVSGTIPVASTLFVQGAFITIDGTTAPAPGITLRPPAGFDQAVLSIRGTFGAHDVIVRGIRIRGAHTRDTNVNSSNDCLAISRGAYRVLIDHVSISGCSDGAIDIAGFATQDTRDVTVQWSILADTRKTMLVKYGTTRITLHHNLFVKSVQRLPYVSRENLPADSGLTLDMRNNVIYDWAGGAGTIIRSGVTANVVGNVYANPGRATNDQRQALMVCRGDGVETPESRAECLDGIPSVRARAYTAGNLSLDGVDLDAAGTVDSPFATTAITTTTACFAAHEVAQRAGAQPRDQRDTEYAGHIVLPQCPGEALPPPPDVVTAPPPPVAGQPDLVTTSVQVVATVKPNVGFPIAFTVANQGTAVAPPSRYQIYLSTDAHRSADDLVLRSRDLPEHSPGRVSTHAITEYVPTSVAGGAYYLLFVADSNGQVVEGNEANNVLATPITVLTGVTLADLVTTSVELVASVTRGAGFPISFTVANEGTAVAPTSKYRIYLSSDARLSADDLVLRTRDLTALSPGQVSRHAITESVPTSVRPGSYYVLFVADSTGQIRESSESNNVRSVVLTVR
jgi:hypothetical protein